jgi:hypothetical protein
MHTNMPVPGAVSKKCFQFFISVCSFLRGQTSTWIVSVSIIGLCIAIFCYIGNALNPVHAAKEVSNGNICVF